MSRLLDRIVRRPSFAANGLPTAAASPEQAPTAPDSAQAPRGVPERISFRERGQIRRRIRYLRRFRELQLRDLGGFLVELERFRRRRPELVRAKLEQAARTDAELRALSRALGAEDPVEELRVPGIGGACPSCGAIHGSADRFCSACGAALANHAREQA